MKIVVRIGSGNDLASNRLQAIAWTNLDQDFRRHEASLGYNELIIRSTTADWPVKLTGILYGAVGEIDILD